MSNTVDKKRIAKNTLFLYTRQLFIMLMSLYTVRVVLDILGVEDYGIFNVVAGVVALFNFLSASMASATQRYFSFSMGKGEDLSRIFGTNMLIHAVIALVAVIILETAGLWFVANKLNVPETRISDVCYLYHFSVLSFLCLIFYTPFIAIIIAHEEMQVYAGISIAETLLKLGIVFLLQWIPGNKLVTYGGLLFAVSLCTAAMYSVFCIKRFKECTFRNFKVEKTLLFEILSFTWWTLFGAFTCIVRNQAVTILLNQIFSPVVVASRAIALQVSGCVNILSSNFNVGLYPPIIKEYAAGKKEEMFQLIFSGSKMCFFLMWILCLPLYLEMDYILKLWLKTLPEDVILFARLSLVESLILSVSMPLITAARAPGKMKAYELILGTLQILIFPASWIVLKFGGAAYTVFLVAIIANIIMFFVRLGIVHYLIQLPLRKFIFSVTIPVLLIMLISGVPSYLITEYCLPSGFLYTCISGCLCLVLASICMFWIGFRKLERDKIIRLITQKIQQKRFA